MAEKWKLPFRVWGLGLGLRAWYPPERKGSTQDIACWGTTRNESWNYVVASGVYVGDS